MQIVIRLAQALYIIGGFFFRGMVMIILGAFLVWLLGAMLPLITDTWRRPQTDTTNTSKPVIAESKPASKPAEAVTITSPPPPPKPVEPKPNTEAAKPPQTSAELDVRLLDLWEHDWPGTISVLEEFIKRNPNDEREKEQLYSALINYGDEFDRKGAKDQAVAYYNKAIAVGVDDTIAKVRLARINGAVAPPVPPSAIAAAPPAPAAQQAARAPQQVAPPPAPQAKPQSGRLGSASMTAWCDQLRGNLYQSRASFPKTEGWYCSIVSMTAPTRDVPIDLNDVCRRAYNNSRAVGRYLNNNATPYDVECSAP